MAMKKAGIGKKKQKRDTSKNEERAKKKRKTAGKPTTTPRLMPIVRSMTRSGTQSLPSIHPLHTPPLKISPSDHDSRSNQIPATMALNLLLTRRKKVSTPDQHAIAKYLLKHNDPVK